MAVHESTTRHKSGPAVAAFLSAAIGLLVLGITQVATELSEAAKELVFDVGKAWIPHAEHIGPYSGKETLQLVAWMGSWIVLHLALRNREPDVRVSLMIFLALLLAATLLVWPPTWHWLEGV